jgi:oligoribonuclease
MKDQKLSWIDLESTGFTDLNTRGIYKHKLLEIAVLITTKDLKYVDELNLVIGHDKTEAQYWADDYVLKMHTENGLWDECAASSLTYEQAEDAILAFFKKHDIGVRHSALWGNSVYLDRAYIETKMPRLSDHLHYQNGDISAVKNFIKLISPEFEPVKAKTHRAMDDIKESVAEAQVYMDLFRPHLEKLLQIRKAKERAIRERDDGPGFAP